LQDWEEYHLQGPFSIPLHMHLFFPNLLLSNLNLNCREKVKLKRKGRSDTYTLIMPVQIIPSIISKSYQRHIITMAILVTTA